jgi:hypothetical protein
VRLRQCPRWAFLLLASVLCLLPAGAWAGTPDPEPPDAPPAPAPVELPGPVVAPPESGWVGVPIVMYSPETHLGAGGVVVHFFSFDPPEQGPAKRLSSVALLALVTTRKQVIVELFPDLYFQRGGWRFWNKLEFQRFPDSFWGIGPRTAEQDEERYLRTRLRWRADMRRRIAGDLYAGLRLDLQHIGFGFPDEDGLFARNDIPGEAGGISAGVGPLLTWDSRDLTTDTHQGSLVEVALVGFHRALGSTYGFTKLMLDGRHFFPLTERQALGVRLYAELNAGDPPFFQMALLGGDELLRGYFLGRYRDRNMLLLGTEYRFPIYWRLGGVAFAGAGQVGPTVAELPTTPLRWAVGGGLRLALNEAQRLNLRLDAGVGPGTRALYLSAGEAF